MIGGSERPENMPVWKRKVLKFITILSARMILILGPGMLYYKYERPNVDYSKYLGPDWKASYECPSTYVSNHSCWVDIILITILKFPSFTPKSAIRNWPFIGTVGELVF